MSDSFIRHIVALIATLAYVRHKLQRSFYAKAGSNNHAVELKYATTAHIARAAYELLRDIGAKPKLGVPADSAGYIDEAWLLERTCSFGPEMIHESEIVDANLEELGSEIKEVNVKEYFALSKGVQAQTESALTTVAVRRPPMAQIKFTVDGLVFTVHNDKLKVLLTKRKLPPQADLYALPGGFLWEGENGKACAIRILRDKASVEVSDLEQLATFDSPIRDPRGHMVSTVYFALSNYESLADSFERNQKTITANHESQSIDNLLFDVDNLPETAFDHATIIAHGVERLRAKASYSNILKNILPAKFHKSDFTHMVQIVAGKHVAPEVVLNTFLSHEVITWTTDLDKNKLYEFSDPNLTTYDNM
jgi:8-oxo-dGTP diphosphatase